MRAVPASSCRTGSAGDTYRTGRSLGRYPISLDLLDLPVLVVGGGRVAARKMPALLEAKARVTVVSPSIHPELSESAENGRIRWISREYIEGDEAGFPLVFALTDSKVVNERIVLVSRGFVNSATASRGRPVTLPFSISSGPLTVSVGSEGGDPVLVRDVGKTLDDFLNGRGIPDFFEEHAAMRDALHARGTPPAEIAAILGSFSVAWAIGMNSRDERLVAYGDVCGRDVADSVRKTLDRRENP